MIKRLDFLDGIRASAALYVLFFHVIVSGRSEGIPDLPYTSLLMYGHEAVVVFIVVSGYSLMFSPLLSVSKSTGSSWVRFMKRRSWRILPPYYAALFMWPLFLTIIRGLKQLTTGVASYQEIYDMIGNGNLLSHLFLLHNMERIWNDSINPALWSVATEFQIYIIFIFLLLPLWRRMGILATVIVAFAIGLVPLFILPRGQNLEWAAPQFVGIFALGMAASVISFSDDTRARTLRERLSWSFVAIALVFIFVGSSVAISGLRFHMQWLTDTILGLAAAAGIVSLSKHSSTSSSLSTRPKSFLALEILESKPMTFIGQFSYSLYLIQLPMISILGVSLSLLGIPMAILQSPVFGGLVVIPLIMGASYLFYLLIEQWFTPQRLDHSNKGSRL